MGRTNQERSVGYRAVVEEFSGNAIEFFGGIFVWIPGVVVGCTVDAQLLNEAVSFDTVAKQHGREREN